MARAHWTGLCAAVIMLAMGCGGGGGNGGPPPVIDSFTATPTTSLGGQPVTLAWTMARYTESLRYSLAPAVGPLEAGQVTVTPAATTTYTLTATDDGGSDRKSVTVTVTGRTLALRVNGMVYDPVRGRLVVAVSAADAAHADSLAFIDPQAGVLEQSLALDDEPRALAMAGDASCLYVGLDALHAVQKVDLATRTAGYRFALGTSTGDLALRAQSIAVLPGLPDSVAIATGYGTFASSPEAGVTVYDGGVARPVRATWPTMDLLTFGDRADLLYGFDSQTPGFQAFHLAVDASGASVTLAQGTPITQFGMTMAYSGGNLFFSNGDVLRAADLAWIGSYPVGNFASMCSDAASQRVYFASSFGDVTSFGQTAYNPSQPPLIFSCPVTFLGVVTCGDQLALSFPGGLALIPVDALK